MTLKVKICGLSTADTMQTALDAGADMVGLVYCPPSPRHIALDQAATLANQARGSADIVVLLVDPDDATVQAVADKVKPDWLQLHGKESAARVRQIKAQTGLRIIKALGVSCAADIEAAQDYADVTDLLLLDASPPKDASRPGGWGEAFDWSLLHETEPAMPYLLAGGLNPDNVTQAIEQVHPFGVDVSSGVESARGVKDNARIKAFVKAARAAR